MSQEKVSIKKFTLGFIQPVEWFKALSTGLKVVIFLLLAYMIYQTFFVKKQTQTQKIWIEKGAQATIVQKQERKKILIPFVEGGIEKNSDVDLDTYIRAGLRFEW